MLNIPIHIPQSLIPKTILLTIQLLPRLTVKRIRKLTISTLLREIQLQIIIQIPIRINTQPPPRKSQLIHKRTTLTQTRHTSHSMRLLLLDLIFFDESIFGLSLLGCGIFLVGVGGFWGLGRGFSFSGDVVFVSIVIHLLFLNPV